MWYKNTLLKYIVQKNWLKYFVGGCLCFTPCFRLWFPALKYGVRCLLLLYSQILAFSQYRQSAIQGVLFERTTPKTTKLKRLVRLLLRLPWYLG